MNRRRFFKIAAVVVAVPVLLLLLVLLYLNFADLSGWKDTVTRLASDAIGRELRINGEFEPEIGFTTRVVATDITLANANWSDDPRMVSVRRLAAEIDLLSIFFGPITIGDVEISGARVLFEVDDEGRFNWAFGSGEPGDGSGGDVELVIAHVLLDDAQLIYARPQAQPLEAALSKLEFTDDGTGVLDLGLLGTLQGNPVEISGRLGTFIGLINAAAIEHELAGRFGDIAFETAGRIAELATLSGADLSARIHGQDLAVATDTFDLPGLPNDPFEVDLVARPATKGSEFELDAEVGKIIGTLSGTVDSLVQPAALDVNVDLSGPNVATVGALTGVDGLPENPFSVTGRVQWAGFPLTCENVEVRVGDNRLSANGVLGRPPEMLGTDFRFEGEGYDLSALAAIAGIPLPADPFSVGGRLLRVDGGLRVEEVEARVGVARLKAHGVVGDPPEYAGTDLRIHASIPNPDRFDRLAGRSLPALPLTVDGRFVEGRDLIDLDAVSARLGHHRLEIDGEVATVDGLVGSDLQIHASGDDLYEPASFAGIEDVPSQPYDLTGDLRVTAAGYELTGVEVQIGEVAASADGTVSRRADLMGTALDLAVQGPDLREVAWLTTFDETPAGDFEASGRVAITERGYEIAAANARVGGITAAVDGVLTDAHGLEGTEVTVDISGRELSALEALLGRPGLPSVPFTLAGDLRIDADRYHLDAVRVEVDGSHATLTGAVAATPDLTGTDLKITADVPDLEHLGQLAADLVELPAMPSEQLGVSTRLAIDGRGYLLEDFSGTLGRAEFSFNGRVGQPPRFVGTDLTVESDGPDASLFKAITGLTIPVAPFQVSGRLERLENGIRFHRIFVRIGGYRASVDGSLGELPRLIGTDLEIDTSGPDTNLYEALAGLPDLPDVPFTLRGRFSGTHERFSTRGFRLTFGNSDLEGEFKIDITGKPTVEARLDSQLLDLSPLGERLEAAEDASQTTPPQGADNATKEKGGLFFRDETVDLGWLQVADANVEIRVDQLDLRAVRFRDLAVDVHLENGRLEIPRAAAAGRGEGRMTGSLLLEPLQERYRLETDISLRQVRLDPPDAVTELLERPPIDIDIDLEAAGRTPHELASSSNGALRLVIGKGIFDSSLLDLVTADILLTLLNTFNPFAKEDPTTELQCGVALLSVTDGIAKLEPMAFQSDKMTLLGEGKVDLETENLNLRWVTKPRKGIGISASMITNPYIKLGGTLADPSIELKPLEAVTSTGVAVATLGVSLVAKGLFDRITAEKKVCKHALEEIDARAQGSPR